MGLHADRLTDSLGRKFVCLVYQAGRRTVGGTMPMTAGHSQAIKTEAPTARLLTVCASFPIRAQDDRNQAL